jgi:spore coat protein CotF
MGSSSGTLTDRDIMFDMLSTEKFTSSTYNTAAMESANPQVLQTMQRLCQDKQMHVHEIFQNMQQRGWYKVQPASQSSQS